MKIVLNIKELLEQDFGLGKPIEFG